MPSNLSTPRTDTRRAALQKATQLQYLQTISTRGPFGGIVPDIDPNQLPGNAALRIRNLRARPTPDGHGELLMLAPGFARIRPEAGAPPGVDLPLDGGDPVIMIGQLVRYDPTTGARAGDFDTTPLALTAGDGTPGGAADDANLYRIAPSTNDWTLITYADGVVANEAMAVDRDNSTGDMPGLPQMCTFSAGAPTVDAVTRDALLGGAVDQPVAVICTNLDRVMIYPHVDVAGHDTYDALTSIAGLDPFIAKSCASWNGRVYFLNTSENNIRYSQRIRRTARGTANPDPAHLGSGADNMEEFSRDGLRLEPLGEVLAAYYEDGVAFLHRTGIVTAPDQVQIVTKERGLLSGTGLCNIGGKEHFGIFNDGWWILNEQGTWREVGLAQIEGMPLRKWANYFYQNLDYDNRHRIYCHYIRDFNQVVIVFPKNGEADEATTEVWFLDLKTERVFVDEYDAVVFGGFDLQTVEDIAYEDFIDGGGGGVATPDGVAYETYEEAEAAGVTYSSIGPKFAMEGLVHGTTTGLVFAHDSDTYSRDGNPNVQWLWEAHPRSQGSTRYQLTADRIVVEYIRQLGVAADATVFSGTDTTRSQVRTLNMSSGVSGTVQSARTYFRFSAASMGLRLAGTGPVMIRAWDFDLFAPMIESMRPV